MKFTKKEIPSKTSNVTGVSVKQFGARGDGKTDDTPAIQLAFDQAKNHIFPAGDYLISSATSMGFHNPGALWITDKTAVRNVTFEEGARLYIDGEFQHDFTTFVILKVLAHEGDISRLTFNNLTMFAEPNIKGRNFTALKAIEHRGNHIKDLRIEKADLRNFAGGGIITYASKTTLKNIRTENMKSHGIGARNPYNLGEIHELYIDGYTSINDDAYSIDFSGTQIGNDASTADPRDSWIGEVRNVRSIGSKRGIKTAGHWNLLLENIEVIDSEIYGFFVNKDAPNHTITIRNLLVQNSGEAGMTLNGKANFVMENIRLVNCAEGLLTHNSKVNIKGLEIDGQGRTAKGVRISRDASIEDFTIDNVVGEYPMWIIRGDVTLTNGTFRDNNGRYNLLVHKEAGAVVLDNVTFINKKENLLRKGNIISLQEARKRAHEANAWRKVR